MQLILIFTSGVGKICDYHNDEQRSTVQPTILSDKYSGKHLVLRGGGYLFSFINQHYRDIIFNFIE